MELKSRRSRLLAEALLPDWAVPRSGRIGRLIQAGLSEVPAYPVSINGLPLNFAMASAYIYYYYCCCCCCYSTAILLQLYYYHYNYYYHYSSCCHDYCQLR